MKAGIDTAQEQQGRLPLQVHSLVDEMAGTMYAAIIRTAHERLFLKSWVTFRLPYEYSGRDVDGPLTKRGQSRQEIAVHPYEAGWVRRIFAWFGADRLPLTRILERRNEEQALLPPKACGGYWTYQALRCLLENPCYQGEWAYGRGENVLVNQKDYVKRRLRDKPLKTQHDEAEADGREPPAGRAEAEDQRPNDPTAGAERPAVQCGPRPAPGRSAGTRANG